MFESDAPLAESMPYASGVTPSPHHIEIFPVNLPSYSEERESAAPSGKRKSRLPRSTGSSRIAVPDHRGVIDGSTTEIDSAEGGNGPGRIPDLDRKFEPNFVERELSEEDAIKLAERIRELWGDHQKKKSSVTKSRAQLNMLRSSLAAQLCSYKKHLVRVGRDGGWASFLRERDIPLSTADRYVKQHEMSLVPSAGKLLSEEVSGPTKHEVSTLVKKLERKLRSVLTTAASVTQFMAELEVALNGSASTQ